MASRAVTKSAIDWTAFGRKLGSAGKENFRHIKGTYDQALARVTRLPETQAKIDFAFYKSRMADQAMAASFEQAYSAIKVPYPSDSQGLLKSLDAEAVKMDAATASLKKDIDDQVKVFKEFMAAIDTLPPYDEMTYEMYQVYFPDLARKIGDKQTLYPHTKAFQPEDPRFPLNYGASKW